MTDHLPKPPFYDEARALLVVATAYDNRNADDVNTRVWAEQFARGRWTLDAAVEAVHRHYALSTDFLMPGHVTAILRAERQQPAPSHPELDSAPPASRERVATMVAELADKLGWDRERASRSDPAFQVSCPNCGATRGHPCTRTVFGGAGDGAKLPNRWPHDSRVQAARGQVG